jgi:hypothetical protein
MEVNDELRKCMEQIGNAYSISLGKSEGRKPLERPKRRW